MYLLVLCLLGADTFLVGSAATMLVGNDTVITESEPLANYTAASCSSGSCSVQQPAAQAVIEDRRYVRWREPKQVQRGERNRFRLFGRKCGRGGCG